MVEKLTKNLIPLSIATVGVLIAGAIIYLNQLGLEEKTPETVIPVSSEISEEKEMAKNEIKEVSLEDFAKCLTDKGVKFYGAFWCSWCNRQKQLFGQASQFLPYIECINQKTNQLTLQCQKARISGFPTWEFKGKKEIGFKTLEQLSEFSGCSL